MVYNEHRIRVWHKAEGVKVGRHKIEDKLQCFNVTLEPTTKAVLIKLAKKRKVSRAQLGAELLLLGLTLQTGKTINELTEEVCNG